MEPEVSLLCLQESATGPYREPHESKIHPQPYYPKIHYNITLPSMPCEVRGTANNACGKYVWS
jgi:hypothetical protein